MHRGTYATDAGMHCLWDQAAFQHVTDYDSWEKELLEDRDIERHIAAGHFVPLNLGDDGAMEVAVRVGSKTAPAVLDARESQYLIVGSKPYRLISSGTIGVSGLESVSVPVGRNVGSFALPPNEYAVTVHLMAWDEEPGMQTENGPALGALPDYLVLINPSETGTPYRTAVKTFDQSES